MRAFLLNFIALIVSFIGVAAALPGILPERYIPTVTEKLTNYAASGDDYDVLVIGSSRTYRQIIPEFLDKAMAAGGKPVRTFNLGVDGMRPPEDTYLLEKALALRRKPLKYVIVECNNIRFELREEDANTVRAVYWHDWKRLSTLAAFAFLGDQKKRNIAERMKRHLDVFPEFWEHATYWFQNVTEFGRGNELLSAQVFNSKVLMKPIGADGFHDSPVGPGLIGKELADYEKRVETMRKTRPRFDRSEWVSQAELAKKRRMIEQAGAKMILVVPPYPMNKRFLPDDPAAQAAVIDFSNPLEFPELYTPNHRLDEGHTNRVGSEIYTRHIAERLLK